MIWSGAGAGRVSPHRHAQSDQPAGTPTTIACAGTSLTTTAPAPTTAYAPIDVPHTIVALAPIVAPRPTRVGSNSVLRDTCARACLTLVNTHDGPRNTSGSSVTPSYSDTLFWTRQPSPIVTAPT